MGQFFCLKRIEIVCKMEGKMDSKQKRSGFIILFWPYLLHNQGRSWCSIFLFLFWKFWIFKQKLFIFFSFFFGDLNIFSRNMKSDTLASNWATELIKNTHGQLMWDGDTFQSSSYHSFPFKPNRVKTTPLSHKNSVSFSDSYWVLNTHLWV